MLYKITKNSIARRSESSVNPPEDLVHIAVDPVQICEIKYNYFSFISVL